MLLKRQLQSLVMKLSMSIEKNVKAFFAIGASSSDFFILQWEISIKYVHKRNCSSTITKRIVHIDNPKLYMSRILWI